MDKSLKVILDDKYDPSHLILGFTAARRPIYMQYSYPTCPPIKIITVYELNSRRWNNQFTQRRPPNHDN